MTIKKHEDKYIHINKERLCFALFFSLLGIGLIITSIWSGIEAHNYSREEAHEYCYEEHHVDKDYNISRSGYASCVALYLPVGSVIASIVLFIIGTLSIFAGLGGYN